MRRLTMRDRLLALTAGGALLAPSVQAAEPMSGPFPVRTADYRYSNDVTGQVIRPVSGTTGGACVPGAWPPDAGVPGGDDSCAPLGSDADACDALSAKDHCRLDDTCLGGELGDPWTLTSLFGEDPCVTVAGWVQLGYHSTSDGVFNTHPHHLDLQQGYIYIERIADGSEGIGFGGRFDVLYGTDGPNTQSFGNHPGRWDFQNGFDHGVYGFALPQLYGEVAYKDLSVKVGHFYTLLGYQVVPATGNFFYSIPFTFNFSEAFTHTGALATYKASDNVTVYAGWTLGWDTGFDQLNGGNNFLGGTSVKVVDNVTVTYILTAGNMGFIGDGYTHSIVGDWVINDKWEYVFQSDLVDLNTPAALGLGHYDTIGVNQYLFYTVSEKTKLGGRAEWWKADGTSFYEIAGGVNYYPMANLRVRPEVRYQWAPGGDAPGNNPFGIPLDETIFGIDAILTF